MEVAALSDSSVGAIPARRIDAAGRAQIDHRAVVFLALPLVANSAVQIVLNLTDTWFVGHVSTKALAAVGAVQWLILIVTVLLGSAGLAVQTIVAQAYGARRFRDASRAAWVSLWTILYTSPIYIVVAVSGAPLLRMLGFDPDVAELATEFWVPRVSAAPLAAGIWAMVGFFNGVSRTRITLLVTIVTMAVNAAFNYVFTYRLNGGIAAAAWSTNAAQASGLGMALIIFLSQNNRRTFESHCTWWPRVSDLTAQLRVGIPMGLLPAADMFGFAVFQMMQVRLDAVGGAAAQIVMMLTSISYVPGVGIALAGTTLVGQSIGAGDKEWAMRVGSRVIMFSTVYMGVIGILLALGGHWILPLFTRQSDMDSVATLGLGERLLWVAAAYQLFDGLNLGSVSCLRGAGDARVPLALVIPVSWFLFLPLAHSLTFAPGQGWVDFLPQFGWGAVGGWVSVVVYAVILGTAFFLRWISRRWQSISIATDAHVDVREPVG